MDVHKRPPGSPRPRPWHWGTYGVVLSADGVVGDGEVVDAGAVVLGAGEACVVGVPVALAVPPGAVAGAEAVAVVAVALGLGAAPLPEAVGEPPGAGDEVEVVEP